MGGVGSFQGSRWGGVLRVGGARLAGKEEPLEQSALRAHTHLLVASSQNFFAAIQLIQLISQVFLTVLYMILCLLTCIGWYVCILFKRQWNVCMCVCCMCMFSKEIEWIYMHMYNLKYYYILIRKHEAMSKQLYYHNWFCVSVPSKSGENAKTVLAHSVLHFCSYF
jgi:hypothetical protein